jgi:hypothetical protein
VVVRPTNEQIDNATEYILFTNELSHNACPITLEPFQEGERVCRIIHCGHIFRETGLREWFQRNVRCPVCRYDIRNYVMQHTIENNRDENGNNRNNQNENETENNENDENDESEFDDVIRELNEEIHATRTQPTPSTSSNTSSITPLTSMLASAVRTFINNELNHLPENGPFNELIYTFDIPIDISGGRYRI